MNKATAYKNKYNTEHYDSIHLTLPKGTKEIIKILAEEKDLSVNAYIFTLINKDREALYDAMQLSAFNRERILIIKGNTRNGYEVVLKDGTTFKCRTKLEIRRQLAGNKKHLVQDV